MLKLYKAKLHTGEKTREQIVKQFQTGPKPTEKEIADAMKFYKMLDGAEVIVTDSITAGEYHLASWTDAENARMKEAIYLLEQDAMCGTYIDQRAEFDADWESGEYSPDGMVAFDAADVEIIEALSVRNGGTQ